MTTTTRADQRVSSETAILDAAVALYAVHGPEGISLRDVAQAVGLTHALVIRYFGSKQGLVDAVGRRLADEVRAVTGSLDLATADGLAALLSAARGRPTATRLLVRSGLGDLDASAVQALIAQRCVGPRDDRRHRVVGYASASLVLGWLSWSGFLVPALSLGRVGARRQDQAMAGAAASLMQLARRSEPALVRRPLVAVAGAAPPPPGRSSSRDALLGSAVELFAERGPASVSIRDIARHAEVNHGLVRRHFGSRDELLAEAIEVGSFSLVPGAMAPGGFDIDAVVHAMHHHSPSPRTIARVLVDDIPVRQVRRRYPVVHALLAFAQGIPGDRRPASLDDPRLAAAAAVSLVVGSSIWANSLRHAFRLEHDNSVDAAVADLGRWLLGAPASAP